MDEKHRIPAHPPTPQGYATEEPQKHMLMTPLMTAIGSLIAFFTVVAMVVVLPISTYTPPPSDNWLPLSNSARDGRGLYMDNGCFYCHSGFTRPQDVFVGLYYLYPRISEPGDYYGVDQSPNLFGTERTGPDLSQEGGIHPPMWHVAHYFDPRAVDPLSVMPNFTFFTPQQLTDTIEFNEESGGKEAVLRYATQLVASTLDHVESGDVDPATVFPDQVAKAKANGSYKADGSGSDTAPSGMVWDDIWDMNGFERTYWLTYDPLPPTFENINTGREVFQQRCVGCHGSKGLGDGPAAQFMDPTPDDFSDPGMFTSPTDSDGERYYRILRGGKGTAMEDFGQRLTVQQIWQIVLFLRTIPNNGSQQAVTSVDKYQAWSPPPEMINYIKDHPLEDTNLAPDRFMPQGDVFLDAAHWLRPGLDPQDTVMIGGKLPIKLADIAGAIRNQYYALVNTAYSGALARNEPGLPPKDQIMSVQGIQWAPP